MLLFTGICFFGLFYAYFGYPALLWLVTKMSLSPRFCESCSEQTLDAEGCAIAATEPTNYHLFPALTVLITAHNEQSHIAEKLVNTLMACDHYRDKTEREIEVVVASDGSSDETDSIVIRDFSERGVKLVRLPTPGGKEMAQKEALKQVKGDVIVFTDAKVKIAESALLNFARYFCDDTIGAVSSIDRVEGDATATSGEGFYVRYEMWLRNLESRFGSLVGLSGSCFAVRRSLTDDLRTDLPSDFALLLNVKKRGYKGVHAEDVVHTYKAVKTEEQEFSRKVRTVLRGISTLFSVSEVLNPFRYGFFSWQIFSHKLCRWLVPFFGIFALIGSWILSPSSNLFLIIVLAGAMIILFAVLGYCLPAIRSRIWIKIPLFFVVANLAILKAWYLYLTGTRKVSWQPTER